MSVIKVGDIVDVSDDGRPGQNYSGRGRVTALFELSDYVQVKPLAPLHDEWTVEWAFHSDRITLVDATDAEPRVMLDFSSGATRNRKEHELQYEGFISPLALQMFAEYMHDNRHTADGGVRDSDNWQKGIPDESYRDSLLRHILDIWLIYRGWDSAAREGGDVRKALAGAFFNLQGLMHNEALRDLEEREVSQ